uniref:Uncharacterized protein n=1 Tax=Opuntia streptacantha TaxID=393608 RepID=A0A7C9A537_OPUST
MKEIGGWDCCSSSSLNTQMTKTLPISNADLHLLSPLLLPHPPLPTPNFYLKPNPHSQFALFSSSPLSYSSLSSPLSNPLPPPPSSTTTPPPRTAVSSSRMPGAVRVFFHRLCRVWASSTAGELKP